MLWVAIRRTPTLRNTTYLSQRMVAIRMSLTHRRSIWMQLMMWVWIGVLDFYYTYCEIWIFSWSTKHEFHTFSIMSLQISECPGINCPVWSRHIAVPSYWYLCFHAIPQMRYLALIYKTRVSLVTVAYKSFNCCSSQLWGIWTLLHRIGGKKYSNNKERLELNCLSGAIWQHSSEVY